MFVGLVHLFGSLHGIPKTRLGIPCFHLLVHTHNLFQPFATLATGLVLAGTHVLGAFTAFACVLAHVLTGGHFSMEARDIKKGP